MGEGHVLAVQWGSDEVLAMGDGLDTVLNQVSHHWDLGQAHGGHRRACGAVVCTCMHPWF
jgi:hypothetical protein